MRTKYLFLILFGFITLTFIACGESEEEIATVDTEYYEAFPSLETVATKFLEKHGSQHHLYGIKSYHFEKRPDGWYVGLKDYSKNEYEIGPKLYWSGKKEKYNSLGTFDGDGITREGAVESWVRYKEHNYDENIFYGYPEWSKDVVDTFGKVRPLPDEFLNGLGRAFGNEAIKELGNFHEYDRWEMNAFDREYDRAAVKDEEVKRFMLNMDSSISVFEQLEEQNSGFETFVGNVSIKKANQYMFAWMELMMIEREKEAAKYLPDGLYPQYVRDFAHNMLKSAGKDGIIFTNGDNDTYPVWYMQHKEGLGKDKAILNLSMLNLGRYIHFTRSDRYGEGKVEYRMNDDFYREDSISYFRFESGSEEVELEALFSGLERKASQDSDGKYRGLLPGGDFKWEYDDTGLEEIFPYEEGEIRNAVLIDRGTKDYMMYSQLAIMDIIVTNKWRRPIYFSSTIPPSHYRPFKDNVWDEGFLYRLAPRAKKNYSSYAPTAMLRDKVYDNIISVYSTKGFAAGMKAPVLPRAEISNILSIHLKCAMEHEIADQDEKALVLIKKMMGMIPKGTCRTATLWSMAASVASDAGDSQLGLEIAGRAKECLLDRVDGIDERDERYNQVGAAILRLSEFYRDQSMMDEMRELKDAYDKSYDTKR